MTCFARLRPLAMTDLTCAALFAETGAAAGAVLAAIGAAWIGVA
jgi:hypothetical protein